jgi:hypothetical protein
LPACFMKPKMQIPIRLACARTGSLVLTTGGDFGREANPLVGGPRRVPVVRGCGSVSTPPARSGHGRTRGPRDDRPSGHSPDARGLGHLLGLPDLSPMHALHAQAGGWNLMLHGNVFLQYISQGSERGDDEFGSINWVMAMARRPLFGGELGLRAMVSAEPWTISGCGYPILLATGELCDGEPIVDEQHPHDLFMELAVEYQREITDDVAIHLYAAPAGEPALGPTAFPHRISAMLNPLAPISHHWFDATHIAFGVATAGLYGRQWKVEGSLFNRPVAQ